jgi:hypothetical protein
MSRISKLLLFKNRYRILLIRAAYYRNKLKESNKKFLASFNNHEEACIMLCGKGQIRTQDLGYQSGAP